MTFLIGIDVKPNSYWFGICLETQYFATVLSRDRFMQIMLLHFTNPQTVRRVPQRDDTYKVRYIMEAINKQFFCLKGYS